MRTRWLLSIVIALAICAGLSQARKPHLKDFPSGVRVLDGSPVHDVGELLLHMSNWGAFGSWPGAGYRFSYAPSGEWPAGSGIEHVFVGGLWVGAMKNGVPAVSTAAFESEFVPSPDSIDTVYYSAEGATGGQRIPSLLADDDGDGTRDEEWHDGRDNDGDGLIDEDFAAASDQMMSRWYADNQPVTILPAHNELHLEVHETSYQFVDDAFDDFVGIDYEIKNVGTDVLEDVYLGIFLDGDVGARSTYFYYLDDQAGHYREPVVPTYNGTVSLDYGYICDTSGGSCIGVQVLNHPTDDSGATAPTQVEWSTFAVFTGTQSDLGGPANDFERYELMSGAIIERNATTPKDYKILVSTGPFGQLGPGETLEFSIALVGLPDSTTRDNAVASAIAYEGRWYDADGDPTTGVGGKEYQSHWELTSELVPVLIERFEAIERPASVALSWSTFADEDIKGFRVFRASSGKSMAPLNSVLLPPHANTYVDETASPGRSYDYMLGVYAESGAEFYSQRISARAGVGETVLRQNQPNPFNPSTTISFELAEAAAVELSIYDSDGRHVVTLLNAKVEPGLTNVPWDGRNSSGTTVPSGVYFYRLTAGSQKFAKKMILIK